MRGGCGGAAGGAQRGGAGRAGAGPETPLGVSGEPAEPSGVPIARTQPLESPLGPWREATAHSDGAVGCHLPPAAGTEGPAVPPPPGSPYSLLFKVLFIHNG